MRIEPAQVQRSYDRVAERYAEMFVGELAGKPLDRALLSVVAEDVAGRGGGPQLIGDLGAGPGQIGAYLAGVGAEVTALDLSPAMATLAHDRMALPAVAGSLTALPYGPGSLGGAVGFYCLIHLDDHALDVAAGELARVVVAGGPLLVAFHTGREVRHLDTWHGEDVDLDLRFLEAGPVGDCLERAGFVVELTAERRPYPDEGDTRRTYLLARRSVTPRG
ncbi:MAG TPA: methyltransferase domain-containing protein [Acidimicrobiales bacterium]|nr:methyltransferase domain-containing protein [Acidimicrobiales bacterium]